MATQIVKFPNARLMFRNFRGAKMNYNKEGDRNFCVVLTEEEASMYDEMGLNVRVYEPKSGDGDPITYLKVTVSYKYEDRAPEVVMIKSNGKTYLKESGVGELDFLRLENIKLILQASFYTGDDGKPHCTVYLKTMYAKVIEDEFAAEFAHLPTINSDVQD